MTLLAVFFVQTGEDVIRDGFEGGEVFGRAEGYFLELVRELAVRWLLGAWMPRGRRDREREGLRHDVPLPRISMPHAFESRQDTSPECLRNTGFVSYLTDEPASSQS
jgi:hypothetical protein